MCYPMLMCYPMRFVPFVWLSFTGVLLAAGPEAAPTMAFHSPVAIEAGGQPIDLGTHVMTRCFDGDGDGRFDLFLAGGDGRLWFCRNESATDAVRFAEPVPIAAGSRTRWGNGYTGVVLADLVGSSLPDLIVGHSETQISIHENLGTRTQPKFREASIDVTVQKGCHGRIDVADWNGDGGPDLITGSFGGAVEWHQHFGSRRRLRFAAGRSLNDIRVAYNAHPRMTDFDRDGLPDLILGTNWGSISVYRNEGTATQPRLGKPQQVRSFATGQNVSLRDRNGDDTTPECIDLDGDGVIDLVSGGKKGLVAWLRGVGRETLVEQVREAIATHGDDLPERMSDDAELRGRVFGALTAMQSDLAGGLVPTAERERLVDQLAEVVRGAPRLFLRRRFDLERAPLSVMLAAQMWVAILEAGPETIAHRERVADVIGFQDGYRDLLVDLGILFIDNNTATPEHLDAMLRLMRSIPRHLWGVETITVRGWLGEGIGQQPLRSKSGINIFDLPLGRRENSFAGDAPRPGVTDVFLICLAHEIAHNMLDTVGRSLRPKLFERKFVALDDAAGELVVYREPASRGIDFDATQQKFREANLWDGDPATWKEAWDSHFKGKREYERAYIRGNVHFFLNAPQEAFATLANQYYADSHLMLEFAKTRWEAGHRSNVNQFLLITEYLSDRRDSVPFYVMRPSGEITIAPVMLQRDEKGRIERITTRTTIATFQYDDRDLVTTFELRTR